jgi:hypothetical protein
MDSLNSLANKSYIIESWKPFKKMSYIFKICSFFKTLREIDSFKNWLVIISNYSIYKSIIYLIKIISSLNSESFNHNFFNFKISI